jgi:polyphenol oxidase
MQFIIPDWPAPRNIRAYTTTRQDGHSVYPYSSFNLAAHVGDEQHCVDRNRVLLANSLELPSDPFWLEQTHSNKVIVLDSPHEQRDRLADAAITSSPETICVVMTADCLPILLCNLTGTKVAAIHAGWRGLANGIIENTFHAMDACSSELLAWLGPAIGPSVFEVSEEVFQLFVEKDHSTAVAFKEKSRVNKKWLANIYLLATLRLKLLGLNAIYGEEFCTYSNHKIFYSYRRDHGITGRMATLIWLASNRNSKQSP